MKVDTALLCDAATVRDGLLHILGGGITQTTRSEFPSHLDMTLALRVVIHHTELGSEHDLELVLQDEDGKQVTRVHGKFGIQGTVPPGIEPALALPWNFPGRPEIPHPGDYSLEILIDGIHQKTVPFQAVLEDGNDDE